MDDNWYCHNICNFSKHDQINNTIFTRQMPEYRRELIPDIRPDIKTCNGHEYKKMAHPSISLSTKSPVCLSAEIAKPNGLEYLRSIDIDSVVRGLSCRNSKCSNDCHYKCHHKYECQCNNISSNTLGVDLFNPKLVNINRDHNRNNVWYYNLDCGRRCTENLFNNNTKNIYREKLFKQ